MKRETEPPPRAGPGRQTGSQPAPSATPRSAFPDPGWIRSSDLAGRDDRGRLSHDNQQISTILLGNVGSIHVKSEYDRGTDRTVIWYYVDATDYLFD
jgi:hypothetical protein